ncbi:RidA family protein [Chloroflexota bacterium]
MPRDVIKVDELPKPLGTYCYGTRVEGGTQLFISGTLALDETGKVPQDLRGDMKGQMRKIVENIKITLKAAGATLEDVNYLRIFVTDMKAFRETLQWRYDAYPELWGHTIGDQEAVASTLIQVVSLAREEYMVEMDAIAHIK